MSVEDAKAFLDKVQNDPAFKQVLQSAASVGIKNSVESHGWHFTGWFAKAYESRLGEN